MEWSTLGRPRNPFRGGIHPRNFRLTLLSLCLFLVVVVGSLVFAGYAWAKKNITLVVDGREITLETRVNTVGDLLETQDIQLGPRDRVEPDLATPVAEGMRVVVKRAVPVTVTAGGKTLKLLTAASTVREALQEADIVPGKEDIVTPGPEEEIRPGMAIRVIRVRQVAREIMVPLPYSTRREPDPNLMRGQVKVVQAGRQGKEKQRWVLVYHDGQEVKRVMEASQVVTPPVDRVVRVGTLQQVSRGGRDIRFSRVIDMVANAYTYTGNNTASGVPPRVGVAAVDPRVIPLGTRLYVEGYGYATALDVGSSIRGNRVDLFMESAAEARRWGVRRVNVYVLD
ncbi:ubiquitin-like domain-containing protein [Desulfofundulus salinus]|uniref:ubiquitin-like domain-containing protein n=1 Tax=Desulfofundulus salinus TaxID=2419843 RepID=UPI001401C0A2|nr:ubiquitin-like domain-containing protein [Desulfofundulus salinum]